MAIFGSHHAMANEDVCESVQAKAIECELKQIDKAGQTAGSLVKQIPIAAGESMELKDFGVRARISLSPGVVEDALALNIELKQRPIAFRQVKSMSNFQPKTAYTCMQLINATVKNAQLTCEFK